MKKNNQNKPSQNNDKAQNKNFNPTDPSTWTTGPPLFLAGVNPRDIDEVILKRLRFDPEETFLGDRGKNPIRAHEFSKFGDMRIYHEHLLGGTWGIAFNYGIFNEGVVRAIVWSLSYKRFNDNTYKWKGESFGTGMVPNIYASKRYQLIEDALDQERLSCKQEFEQNKNKPRKKDDEEDRERQPQSKQKQANINFQQATSNNQASKQKVQTNNAQKMRNGQNAQISLREQEFNQQSQSSRFQEERKIGSNQSRQIQSEMNSLFDSETMDSLEGGFIGGAIGGVAGTIVGGCIKGPVGMVAGGVIGGALGGTIGGAVKTKSVKGALIGMATGAGTGLVIGGVSAAVTVLAPQSAPALVKASLDFAKVAMPASQTSAQVISHVAICA